MAFHKAILVLFFLSFLSFQSSIADTIDDVCITTFDPNFCKSAFGNDRRSAGADLKTLAQIGIDLGQSNARSASSLVKVLAKKSETTPVLKSIYETCQENFDDAISDLDDAVASLKSMDYLGLNLHASAAISDASTCDDSFKDGSVPEPAELTAAGKQVRTLASAIAKISNMLRGQ